MMNSIVKYLAAGLFAVLAAALILGICPVVFRLHVESPTPVWINYVSGQTTLSREVPAGTQTVEFIVPFRLIETGKTVFIYPEKQNKTLATNRFEILFCKIRLCDLNGSALEENRRITHDKWLKSNIFSIQKGRETLTLFYLAVCLFSGAAAIVLLRLASRFSLWKNPIRIRQILLCACFWGMLFIPCLVWQAIPRQNCELQIYENRAQDTFPKFSFMNILDFCTNLDAYYTKNFPFRPMVIQFHQYIGDNLGRVEMEESIRGTIPNWYYFEREIPDFIGTNQFTREEISRLIQNLTRIQQYFRKRNIGFLILIPPNKMQVYPDFLPSELKKRQSAKTRCSELVRNLNPSFSDPPILYLAESLARHKEKDVLLYYPNDTHWNMFGAYVAFSQFAHMIDPALKMPSPEDMPWRIEPVRFGDLGRAQFPYYALFPDKNGTEIMTTCDIQLWFSPERHVQHFLNPAAPSSKKLILFHDSFFVSIQPYFKFFFREIHLYANLQPDYRKIAEEKPDMVIIELVERNIQGLLKMPLPPD